MRLSWERYTATARCGTHVASAEPHRHWEWSVPDRKVWSSAGRFRGGLYRPSAAPAEGPMPATPNSQGKSSCVTTRARTDRHDAAIRGSQGTRGELRRADAQKSGIARNSNAVTRDAAIGDVTTNFGYSPPAHTRVPPSSPRRGHGMKTRGRLWKLRRVSHARRERLPLSIRNSSDAARSEASSDGGNAFSSANIRVQQCLGAVTHLDGQ